MTGFQQLADGIDIMNALDPRFRERTRYVRPVVWEDVSPHVIDRGRLKIFPLARVMRGGSDDAADEERFQGVSDRLERDGIHRFGGDWFHSETLLSDDEGYGERLARAGIIPDRRPYAWGVGDHAAVFVRVTTEAERTLSLHVIPAEWVWERRGNSETKREQSRRRSAAKHLAAVDPRWEWPITATSRDGG